MGQFKPMVKMMTTEPSVELKLKKGGAVEKKMQMGGALGAMPAAGVPARGGAMPARGGVMPAGAPGKPSMAARRRAMMAGPTGAAPAAPVGMAGRMMKEGGDTLSEHAAKPASKAHKGLKTGGVVKGQAGFATGGVAKGKGGYATGGVAKANGGGYKKGGEAKMAMGGRTYRPRMKTESEIEADSAPPPAYRTQPVMPRPKVDPQVEIPIDPTPKVKVPSVPSPGGMKKGGSAKKAYATGGLVDTGRPVAMPQGAKKPSKPVSINQLSGTFKKGGAVMMNKGGDVPPKGVEDTIQTARNERAYKAWEKSQSEDNKSMSDGIGGFLSSIPKKIKNIFSPEKAASAPGSVTKTEKSVTVTPKKRGGAVTC